MRIICICVYIYNTIDNGKTNMFLAFHSDGNRFALAGGWGRRPTRRMMMQWQRADKYRKWEPTIHTLSHTHRHTHRGVPVYVCVCWLWIVLLAYRANGESISHLLVNGGLQIWIRNGFFSIEGLIIHRVKADKWYVKCLVAPPGVQSSSPPLDDAAGGRTCWHSCAKLQTRDRS